MRRWTDGKSWSASRVSGSFLTYREMEGKRGGSALPTAPAVKRASGKSPEGSATGDSDGEGPDGYRYKPDGLMKQSFSITTSSGQHLHLISYYSRSNSNNLPQPTNDAQLRHIRPPKNMYPESTVNETLQRCLPQHGANITIRATRTCSTNVRSSRLSPNTTKWHTSSPRVLRATPLLLWGHYLRSATVPPARSRLRPPAAPDEQSTCAARSPNACTPPRICCTRSARSACSSTVYGDTATTRTIGSGAGTTSPSSSATSAPCVDRT
jgi:hypothetical protein